MRIHQEMMFRTFQMIEFSLFLVNDICTLSNPPKKIEKYEIRDSRSIK